MSQKNQGNPTILCVRVCVINICERVVLYFSMVFNLIRSLAMLRGIKDVKYTGCFSILKLMLPRFLITLSSILWPGNRSKKAILKDITFNCSARRQERLIWMHRYIQCGSHVENPDTIILIYVLSLQFK